MSTPPIQAQLPTPYTRAFTILKHAVGPVLFLIFLSVLYKLLQQYSYQEIVEQVQSIPRERLYIAIFLCVANYFVLTLYDTLAFEYIQHPLKYLRIGLTAFISYTFSHNIGFAVLSGGAVRYHLYSAWGIPAGKIAQVIAFSGLHFWMGLLALGGIACFFSPVGVAETFRSPLWVAYALGTILVGLVIVYLVFLHYRKEPIRFRNWDIPVPGVRLTITSLAVACIDWILAASVLYFLLPPSPTLLYSHLLFAFFLGQLAGVLSHVPGGLGVLEFSIAVALGDTFSKPTIIGSLILFRVIYYVIPFFIGGTCFVLYEIKRRENIRAALSAKSKVAEKWLSVIVPRILAIGAFIGGTALLFSGSTPTGPDRIWWLDDFMPLFLIEASHFINSVVGTALLFLSWGIRKRVDVAYPVTLLLLALGIVVSLIKGFDYEEATLLVAMLLLVLPCRRYFYRKTSLLAGLTTSSVLSISAVIAASVWLGFFSFKHVDYTNHLWWEFEANSDAPRFLRGSVAAVLFGLFVGLKVLIRSALPSFSLPTDSELTEAIEIINKQSNTTALLALLRDKYLLFNEERDAFIMFRIVGRSWIALGDPIGPESSQKELVWQFRDLCDQHGGLCTFYEVSSEHLSYYIDAGLSLLKLGEEAIINLAEFSLDGSSMKTFRSAVRRLEREGFTFQVYPTTEVSRLLPQLQAISDSWLTEKSTKEKGFSIGFFSEEYLLKTPIATIEKGGEIFAFANIWCTDLKRDLSVDLMRQKTDCPNGIMDLLFIELMLWGKENGYTLFNLGMAPLSGLESRRLAPLWSRLGALLYRQAENFYNFEGVRRYEEKYNPTWTPRYLASPGGLKVPGILTNVATLISGGVKGLVSRT